MKRKKGNKVKKFKVRKEVVIKKKKKEKLERSLHR